MDFENEGDSAMADNFKTIKCPACQHEMVKIFMPKEGVNIDVCLHGCGGIYFDNREFKYFDEPHEDINELLKAVDGKEFIKVDEDLPRSCPVCGARMVKNHTSVKREVVVDECYACGGKFLDNGELQKIRSQYTTEEERSADVMKEVYDTVGIEIKRLEAQNAELRANRSPLKKLFDHLIYDTDSY